MKKKLLILIILTISLLSVNESYASHAAAVDLTYECLGGNRYVFTLKVYRDCQGAALRNDININLRSTLCGENFNFNMERTSITEVSQVCDAVLPNTACNGGPLPGIEEHTYTDTVTLPANCTDWIGSYTLCCRNNAITNVNNGNLYSEVRINNSAGQCNSSPQFNSGPPLLFGCAGLPVNFNNAAFDPDGDSLVYQLVNPWSANNTPLAYLDPSFSPTNPMFTTNGFMFDSITGQITFTSPNQQVPVVSVLVSEYDSLGNFKGSVRRDLQFLLLNCPDIDPPTVTGVDYDTTGTQQSFVYNACFTDSFCFEIYGLSGVPGTPVDLIYNGGFPGGIFSTTTSGDTTFGTFCWNPGTRVGDYFFTIRAEADVCPAKVINVYNYTINIDTNFTVCTDTIIYLDAAGSAWIDSTYVIDDENSPCLFAEVKLDQNIFTCADLGTNTVGVTSTFTSNNLVKSCNSIITVLDTIPPMAICQDTAIVLDAAGNFTIDSSFIDDGSNDNCGLDRIILSRYNFSCTDLGVNTIMLYAIDINGNIDSCSANVTVTEQTNPIPVCQNSTIYLNAIGSFTIDSSFINDGSTDNCGIETITLSNYTYTCADTGANTVTMYVTDSSGNTDSCSAIVSVIDSTRPSPICKDTTIYLNAGGTFVIDSSYLNDGSTDNCAISTITINQTIFNCINIGVNPVVMTVTDVSGNVNTCNATVTILDSIRPTPVCQDTTIYLNATGTFTIDSSYTNNGSSDNCGISTITLSQYIFNCADTGTNQITMYVTDVNGNIDSCFSNITIIDTTGPVAICKDTTVYIDFNGQVTIDSSFIDNGSTDACGIITLSRSQFFCSDVGVNVVTLYVTDGSGNRDSCNANVTVLDTIAPFVRCKDTLVYLDVNGQFTIDSSYVDNGSSDSCQIISIRVDPPTFVCSDLGVTTVFMIVEDVNGNSDTCIPNITVIDTLIPTPICQDTTVYLNNLGVVTIDSSFVDNGSFDNCSVRAITLSKYDFNCGDTGVNVVTMYVTDNSGNIDSCVANLTIVDTTGPVALCRDTTIYLSALGQFVIDSSFIDGGSTDACGVLTISQSVFDCSHIGPNNVTLYVSDANNNIDSCVGVVTVLDTVQPNAICNDTTVYLNAAGQVTIDSSFIAGASNDACGVLTISISNNTFSCTDTGINMITVTVTDINGNSSTCVANVIVRDTIIPSVNAGVDDSLCNIYTYALNGNIPSGTLIGSWSTISGPNAPSITNPNAYNSVVTGLIEGVYEFEWLITNGPGCNISRDTVLISVFNNPVANAGADSSLCNVYSMGMRADVPAGSSTGVWSFVTPIPTIPVFTDATNPSTVVSNLDEGTYTFVWTVSNGICSPVTDTMLIEVYDLPSANAGQDVSLCATYNTLLIGNTPPGRATGIWSYVNGPNVPVITSPTNPVTGVNSMIEGTYTLVWTVSNGVCDPATDTILINIYDQPVADAGANQNLCAVYNTNLDGNILPPGTASGRWVVAPGSIPPSVPTFADSSVYNTNISNLQEGRYEFIWIVSNGVCPNDADTVIIDVWDRPTADVGPDTNLCSTYDLQLYANSDTGLTQGFWTLNAAFPNPNVPNIVNGALHNATVLGMIEGQYEFIWRVTNGPCFVFADTLRVNVFDQPVANAGFDQDLCNNLSTILSANAPVGTASGQWILTSGTPNNPTFNPSSPSTSLGNLQESGTYRLMWEMRNGTCPVSRDTVQINNFAVPVTNFTQDSLEICAGDCIGFTNLSTIHPNDNITSYRWLSGGSTYFGENPTMCWPFSGIYDVHLITESSNGCSDTLVRNNLIRVNTVPIADFNVFLVDDDQASTKIQIVDQSQFSTSYSYDLGDGATSDVPSLTHIYADSGFYDIVQIVSNSFGCRDTLTRTIFVHILLVYVPNAFTPDGDGVNDGFMPSVDGDDPDSYLFRVYDRWGELIFQTQVKGKPWDGTYKGQPVKTDAYVWTLKTKYRDGDRIKEYRGHVNLLR